ncbi:MAG: hypothetical protein AAGF59_00850 [Pseudomonadota bacterium]
MVDWVTQIKMAAAGLAVLLSAFGMGVQPAKAAAETVTVTGEIMDTWCYFSGVMGGPEAVVGSAHHTCAMWCAAGGIPVGILADDGTVYMVLKLEGVGTGKADTKLLSIQSDRVTATGDLYRRDGLNYLVVNDVVSNEGITNRNHEDYGVIPGFVIPELN